MDLKVLLPTQILALSFAATEPMPSFSVIDFSRPFVPEHFTQLYHTPFYSKLTFVQKLRYNQLFGIRTNEQFLMFEEDFANRVVVKMLRHPAVIRDEALGACLVKMIEEEERHQEMFMRLNRLCLPEVYSVQARYFTKLNSLEKFIFRLATAAPRQFSFLLLAIMLLEESTTALSRSMTKSNSLGALGSLEDNFVKAHVAHLKDEVRHLHIDINLIEACLANMPGWKSKINAILFKTIMREILLPKRSGLVVIRHLVQEFPELEPIRQAMINSVFELQYCHGFIDDIFNRKQMPLTFRVLDAHPEFHFQQLYSG